MTSQSSYVLDGYSLVDKTLAEGMAEAVGRHFFIVKDFEISIKLLMNGLAAHRPAFTGDKQAVCFWIPSVLHPFLIRFDEIVVY
nr:hypothetical protein [Thermoactinomyces sp. CICC 10735]